MYDIITKIITGLKALPDLVQEAMVGGDGKKNVQTEVTSPAADGNTLAFIDTISQDTQGVITPTKKNVNVANTLTVEDAGSVLDARQGKVLSDKINGAVAMLSTQSAVSVNSGTYTNVDSNKPSDATYTWRLIAVLPAAATTQVIGIDPLVNRFLAKNDSSQAATVTLTMTWLGFKVVS